MEEILASIRRIIDSGDDVGRSPRAARDNAAAPRDESYRVSEAYRQRDHDAGDASPAAQDPEPFGDNSFVSRRPAFTFDEDSQPSNETEATHGEEAEQPFVADHQEPVTHQATEQEERQAAAPRPHPLEHDAVYPGTIGEVARQVREATGGAHEPKSAAHADETDHSPRTEERQDSLLSTDSEQRIGNALHALSDALDREGARKIEEIVISELRPLLRDWIEEHMPSIVEEMVGKEIERMRNAKR
ncbi:DUF2497 domain-containing protein [Martelella sp. FLE1502]